jgi:hypothetical protein
MILYRKDYFKTDNKIQFFNILELFLVLNVISVFIDRAIGFNNQAITIL